MTLASRVAIVEPTAVKEVFDICRALIGGQSAEYIHEDGCIRNKSGQGLPALLWIDYGVDAPMVPNPEYAEEDSGWRAWYPPVEHWSMEVVFDTAYGYRANNGANCEDLHAWLIQELGEWLTDNGLSWFWYQESTGTWHPSTTPVTLLGNSERGRLPAILEAVTP